MLPVSSKAYYIDIFWFWLTQCTKKFISKWLPAAIANVSIYVPRRWGKYGGVKDNSLDIGVKDSM